jgi:subfamily B ATP-binding cassette protein MsbA
MDVVSFLIEKFYDQEKFVIIILIILSLTLTAIQINGISYITAQIIQSAQANNIGSLFLNYKWFIAISLLFFTMYYVYKKIQYGLMAKMTQWTKNEIFKIILKMNNVNMSNVNYVEFVTPITRIATSFYILFSNVITSIIPIFAFLFSIMGFFLYKNINIGLFFLIGNVMVAVYVYMFWDSMLQHKKRHESVTNENEFHIMDILNNIDKVIYRGQCNAEMDVFSKRTDNAIDVGQTYISKITDHTMSLNAIVYCTIFTIGGYLIYLKKNDNIDTTSFITFFTMLLLYRDRMLANTNELSEYVEFVGRIQYINQKFNEMIGISKDPVAILNKEYEQKDLKFDTIRFKNVSFYYEGTDKMILSNFNITLKLNKIIGITGLSGRGKSSFTKLCIRLYEPTEGDIFIDDINLREIDPHYIRQNMIYVNQNSKLFNKKIMENLMYGCSEQDTCDEYLTEILKNTKIRDLFKKVDIKNGLAGNLGENLSGGQRQMVNIISGLINPAKIVILDEPTNALDKELKTELLSIIAKFKKYKKAIIIISHDRDVFPLFDETVKM